MQKDKTLKEFFWDLNTKSPDNYYIFLRFHMYYADIFHTILENKVDEISDESLTPIMLDYFTNYQMRCEKDVELYNLYSDKFTSIMKKKIKVKNSENPIASGVFDDGFASASEMWSELNYLVKDKLNGNQNEMRYFMGRLNTIIDNNDGFLMESINKKRKVYFNFCNKIMGSDRLSGNNVVSLLNKLKYGKNEFTIELNEFGGIDEILRYDRTFFHKILYENSSDVMPYLEKVGVMSTDKFEGSVYGDIYVLLGRTFINNIGKGLEGFAYSINKIEEILENGSDFFKRKLASRGYSINSKTINPNNEYDEGDLYKLCNGPLAAILTTSKMSNAQRFLVDGLRYGMSTQREKARDNYKVWIDIYKSYAENQLLKSDMNSSNGIKVKANKL